MFRWRLLLGEYHPKIVHVVGVDNNIAYVLSCLNKTNKVDNLQEHCKKNKRLNHTGLSCVLCMFMSGSNFKDNEMNGDILMLMTREHKSSLLLDMVLMRNAELNDVQLLAIVHKHIDKNKNNSIYTYKKVEDIKIIFKG